MEVQEAVQYCESEQLVDRRAGEDYRNGLFYGIPLSLSPGSPLVLVQIWVTGVPVTPSVDLRD